MKTGIFPGSFNPIHIGHLALANWICEFCDLDELWFLVSPQNPLKEESGLMEEDKRLQMVEASIDGYPGFKVSNFEFALPRPSYTITTLRELQRQFPDKTFQLIMGADNWSRISRWKNHEALMSEFPIIIYPRKDYEITIPPQYANIKKVDAPLLEISSTFIRQAFHEGKDIRFFLPEKVREIYPFFIP
ncbi:MAG: nicotinate-nucleotide adenylyltransferase [Tannerella sp.]|jgi:nicotinate-nucleotide adenylyltransferase|nr:nicotinate-nucleotide adenylyltransferase [Tannerella sp.]